MGFFANQPDDEDRIASMGAMNPIQELTPDGSFSGLPDAIYKGVAGAGASVGRLALGVANGPVGQAFANSGQATADSDAAQNPFTDQSQMGAAPAAAATIPGDESLKAVQDWAKADPRTQGAAAQAIGGLAHGATVFGLGTLAGGPVAGAGLLGSTEGYSKYRDDIAAGVDSTTAAQDAGLTATTAALGAFLPMKFGAGGISGLFSSMAGGAAVNTGFGIANRYLTSELLDHGGYPEMAKQYRPMDAQALAADAVMGLAFGGFAHTFHGSNVPAAERPSPPMIEAALDARRNEMVGRGAGGMPVDPATATLDSHLQDAALDDMLRGKPTEVAPEDADSIVKNSLVDPERVQLNEDYAAAGARVFGDMADFSEPPRLTEAVEPFVPAEELAPVPGAPEPEPSGLSPMADEQLRQLAERHPDMEVQTPSGNTVAARDLPAALKADMASATKDSKLHDVAVACFTRTL